MGHRALQDNVRDCAATHHLPERHFWLLFIRTTSKSQAARFENRSGQSDLPSATYELSCPAAKCVGSACVPARIAERSGQSKQLGGIFIDITDQKSAEAEAALQHQEIAHLMRVAVLGELSGSIAHEINQPLTAILSNAQAALHLLGQKSPDLEEIRDALEEIVHEDNRAGEVIHRLRHLLKKGERKLESVNINDLVRSTVALLHSELIGREIGVRA